MKKIKKNTLLILIIYVLGIVFRGITFNMWETELNFIYEIGKYLGSTLIIISIIWSISNGLKILKAKEIEYGIINSLWLLLNLIPTILLLSSLIFHY